MKRKIIARLALLCALVMLLASCRAQTPPAAANAGRGEGEAQAGAGAAQPAPVSAQAAGAAAPISPDDLVTDFSLVKTKQAAAQQIAKIYESGCFSGLNTASTLYYIKCDSLNPAERMLMLSLQGIVAQTKSEIFMYYQFLEPWFQALQEYYGIQMVEVKDVWDMVSRFKGHLADKGFVRYHFYNANEVEFNFDNPQAFGSSNIATMISGVDKYLMVDDSLIAKAQSVGLVQKADALDYPTQLDAVLELYGQLNKNVLTSIEVGESNLRDITVALKMACWRDSSVSELKDIITLLGGKNGIILGWHDSEGDGVHAGSSVGWATIASDHGNNYSVYAGLKKSQFIQKPGANYEKAGQKVHYVTFMMTDGDNVQYIERGYIREPKYFGSPLRGTIPFGWTLSPSLLELSPLFPNALYKEATINDEFVTSVSGAGYTYPSVFDEEQFDAYLDRTSAWMKGMNQRYVQILDWFTNTIPWEKTVKIRQAYAKRPDIKGGFVYPVENTYLYPDMAGSITWANGKPFVAPRESLWVSTSTADMASAKIELMAKTAYRINRYKKDPSVIEGYTFVNVHPWSFSYEDVVTFVSLLDDNIVIVTPTEFMEMIKKNVAKTDKLHLTDVSQFDYTGMQIPKTVPAAIAGLPVTEQTRFTFAGNSEGWQLLPGGKNLDQIRLVDESDGTRAVQMAGSHFGQAARPANASMYNKIKIPQSAAKLAVTYSGSNALLWLMEYSDGNTEKQIGETLSITDVTSGTVEFDISAVAGKTTTICLQFSDLLGNGANFTVREIEIK